MMQENKCRDETDHQDGLCQALPAHHPLQTGPVNTVQGWISFTHTTPQEPPNKDHSSKILLS